MGQFSQSLPYPFLRQPIGIQPQGFQVRIRIEIFDAMKSTEMQVKPVVEAGGLIT